MRECKPPKKYSQVRADFNLSALLSSREQEMRRAAALDDRPGVWDAVFVEGETAFAPPLSEDAGISSPNHQAGDNKSPATPYPTPTILATSIPLAPTSPVDMHPETTLSTADQERKDARTKHNQARKKRQYAQAQKNQAAGKPVGSAFGRDHKTRRLWKKLHKTAVDLQATDLPHSTKGYIGTPNGSPAATESSAAPAPTTSADGWPSPPPWTGSASEPTPSSDPRDIKLQECKERGYQYVKAKDQPDGFVDDSETLSGWKTGVLGNSTTWKSTVAGVGRAIIDLDKVIFGSNPRAKTRPTPKAGAARGKFRCSHFGFSYGGGQKIPTSMHQTERTRAAWNDFLENPHVKKVVDFITNSFENWAPNLFDHYQDSNDKILRATEVILDLISGEKPSPFASMTVNFGPMTVCRSHRDLKNLAYGLCAIMVLGNFDYRRGGHLILHEYKLVIEMKPGDIIFIPSAIVTHENVMVAEGETRQSLVFFSAGGLFRWSTAGCQSLSAWAAKDPEAFTTHEETGEERWKAGWNLFSKIPASSRSA